MKEQEHAGRQPAGLEYVDNLEGPAESKKHPKVILDTLWGELRLMEACAHRSCSRHCAASLDKNGRLPFIAPLLSRTLDHREVPLPHVPLTTSDRLKAEGLEPSTYGLKVRCSTD